MTNKWAYSEDLESRWRRWRRVNMWLTLLDDDITYSSMYGDWNATLPYSYCPLVAGVNSFSFYEAVNCFLFEMWFWIKQRSHILIVFIVVTPKWMYMMNNYIPNDSHCIWLVPIVDRRHLVDSICIRKHCQTVLIMYLRTVTYKLLCDNKLPQQKWLHVRIYIINWTENNRKCYTISLVS